MLHPAQRQRAHDVGLVGEAVAHQHREKALADLANFEPPLVGDVRHVLGVDLHYHDPLVERFIVLQGVQQRDRHLGQVAGHENGRPRHPYRARRAIADYDNDALAKPLAESSLAIVQAQFGDIDSAIAALPHLLEVPNGETCGNLQFNPRWDPLRKDPRFEKLCQNPNK